jgi:hypothetical protein
MGGASYLSSGIKSRQKVVYICIYVNIYIYTYTYIHTYI